MYFTPKELYHSKTAERYGIDNTPTESEKENLLNLIFAILNPLREWYGKPIYVNSGYRCPELNKKVGGAENSNHLYGYAADITTGSTAENEKLFDHIVHSLPFDECISENGGKWIHVAYRPHRNRYKAMYANNGNYVLISVKR